MIHRGAGLEGVGIAEPSADVVVLVPGTSHSNRSRSGKSSFIGAPAVLDLFVWLSYRCFTSKGPERIPIFGPFGLVQQLGAVEYTRPRKFREKLHQWLKTMRSFGLSALPRSWPMAKT
jgi:hypothetical protein